MTLTQGGLQGFAARWKILEPLTIPDFRRLWLANAIWWQARLMEQLSLGWLVLEMTNSPGQVALVGFYRSVPMLLFGFLIGAVAERYNYRQLIISTQVLSCIVLSVLSLLIWTGQLQLWHVAVGAFLLGTGGVFDWSSRRALFPDLVGKERLLDALVIENIVITGSNILGPFLGGVLIEMLGVRGCFPVLMIFCLIGITILRRLSIRSDRPERTAQPGSPWAGLMAGIQYIRSSQQIMGVLLITVFMNALTFPAQTILPVFARDILHQGPIGLGILGASSGVGALIGIVIVNWAKRFHRSGWVFASGSLSASAALIVFAASTSYPLSVAMQVCSGIGHVGFSVMQTSILLRSASDEMRSRMMGALVLAIGCGPLGNLQLGALATAFGAPIALGLSCSAAVLTIAAITAAIPGFRAHDNRPLTTDHCPYTSNSFKIVM